MELSLARETIRGILLSNAAPESIDRAKGTASACVLQACFADFDAVTESIPDYDGEYMQVAAGPISARLVRAEIDRVAVIEVAEEVPAYVFRADAPLGRATLLFATDPPAVTRWRGVPVADDTLVAYGPGAEHVGRSQGRLRSVSVHIPCDAIDAHAARLGHDLSLAPREARMLAPDPLALANLRQATSELLQIAATQEWLLDRPEIRRTQEDAILTSAVLATSPAPARPEHAAISHRRAARRAIELLESHPDEPVYLAEMCEAARVSERTLRSAFQRIYGVSPIRYLHLHRMRQARRALIAADPAHDRVSDVAQRHGFANLGRFAVEFRSLFGRRPSEVLRSPR